MGVTSDPCRPRRRCTGGRSPPLGGLRDAPRCNLLPGDGSALRMSHRSGAQCRRKGETRFRGKRTGWSFQSGSSLVKVCDIPFERLARYSHSLCRVRGSGFPYAAVPSQPAVPPCCHVVALLQCASSIVCRLRTLRSADQPADQPAAQLAAGAAPGGPSDYWAVWKLSSRSSAPAGPPSGST